MADDLFGAPPPSRRKRAARTDADLAEGHRGRLRDRFMSGGAASMPDYELLELILFRAIPRRDVKPLAKRLVERFGDLAGVLAAEPPRLREIEGLGDAAICELKIVQAAGGRLARSAATTRTPLGGGDAVLAYLRAEMARATVEEFRVLFLDKKNQLVRDETLGVGTVDQIAVYPREVVRRALELGASGLILVHNHPSGDPTPSRADIAMTEKIRDAARLFDVVLQDHFIITPTDWMSFRGQRLL